MRVLLIFTIFCAGAFAIPILNIASREWKEFKNLNKKVYKGIAEELMRVKIFLQNKLLIAAHNAKFALGQETFETKINQFGDMLQSEIFPTMKGYKHGNRPRTRSLDDEEPEQEHLRSNKVLPESVDWRDKGAVLPAKNQGNCGSCWSFAAVGALEGQLAIKTGKLTSLSEQNLVDCSRYSSGCDGGDQTLALEHVRENGGIQTEADYPYTGKNGQCKFDRSKAIAKVARVVRVPARDEEALKDALATAGPVAVAIDARNPLLLFYFRGIYGSWFCTPDKLDHAVLAVGYGKERGKEYWLIKNSWGKWWGNHGFFKILKNGKNKCGVASEGTYPILA